MRYFNSNTPSRWEQPSLIDNFDRLFSDMWESKLMRSNSWDVSESDDAYFLSLDAPGMKREDIKIEVTGNLLSVSGERKRTFREDRKERSATAERYGYFSRAFTLPEAVDSGRIEANFEDGVLEISIPKSERAKPRSIQIGAR